MFEEIFHDHAKFSHKNEFLHKFHKHDKHESITPFQIKGLFLMLDVDESGEIDDEEVMSVLQPK